MLVVASPCQDQTMKTEPLVLVALVVVLDLGCLVRRPYESPYVSRSNSSTTDLRPIRYDNSIKSSLLGGDISVTGGFNLSSSLINCNTVSGRTLGSAELNDFSSLCFKPFIDSIWRPHCAWWFHTHLPHAVYGTIGTIARQPEISEGVVF